MTTSSLSGRRLGSYEVGQRVGAGGMGEVYRARDSRLNRDVAIKTLLPAVAGDPERLARFSREAQLLASLNHPNIAHIHGLEDGDGGPFLVMEFVEGPTLAERLKTGPLPLDETLAIARQVAEALEAAHERGVIHRDLKPANIKVTDDGTVKILDFGLAKAIDPGAASGEAGSAANSPTITTPAMTQAGLILGTAAYMSPEQAKGRPVDKRSDVWAFGCVLYEMLTARRAFDGEDVTDTIALVVRGEPDWTALPADTPPQIRLLLKRCLEKDRRARISDMGVARFLMNETLAPASTPPAAAGAVAPRRPPVVWTAAGVVLGAALAAGAWAWSSRTQSTPHVARFAITPPLERAFALQGNDHDAAIAPDGSFVVYRTIPPGLAIRAINELEDRYLPSTVGARFPFISADSQWIGFFVGGELRKAAVSGGAATTIARVSGAPRGASWGDDGTIVFATTLTSGLMRVSAGGGDPTAVTTAEATTRERHALPHILPGSRWALYSVLPSADAAAAIQNARIEAVDLSTGQRKVVLTGGHDAVFIEPGFLIYAITDLSTATGSRFRGSLRAVRFDADRAEVAGDSLSVVDEVLVSPTGTANFGVSRRGDLLFVPGSTTAVTPLRSLVWVNRDGTETPIPAPQRSYAVARISPDGSRIALDLRDQTNDIWIWDNARQTLTPLNRDPAQDLSPLWTPDGKRVIWTSTRGGGNPNLFWQAADGTGTPERLTNSPTNQFPVSITPDASIVVVFGAGPTTEAATDIYSVTLPGPDAKAATLIGARASDFGGELSPDGKWLAYHSNESGEFEVYVRPFPDVQSGRWQISTAGGTRAAWTRNGRELFYLDREGLLTSVPVQAAGGSFSAGVPVRMLKTRYVSGSSILGLDLRSYDVSPDGQSFVMIKDVDSDRDKAQTLPQMVVVLNWVEELETRLPLR
jgi:serine/threonine-protein kinase